MKKIATLLLTMVFVGVLPMAAMADETTFSDVPEDHLFHNAIQSIAEKTITVGCEDELYCPDRPVSRAEMATFIVRAFSLSGNGRDYFHDDNGSVHEDSINALRASGITFGCDTGKFCPHDPVTRAQTATLLVRALGLASTDVDYFWDDENSVFQEAINSLAHYGLTVGCRDAMFCPNDSLTRGEMAALLIRAVSVAGNPVPNPKIDPKPSIPQGGTPEANKQMAKILADMTHGWSGDQFVCLDKLIMSESNWKNEAQNPTSTAYGIFQFLNGTWSIVGAKKTSDPKAQIEAGLDYVDGRYGTPCNAWVFKQRNGYY